MVELPERLANRNYVGTHFGDNLFAMTDPFYALLLMHRLGERYLVWDQSASIEFVTPGRGTVRAVFRMPQETVDDIRNRTASGEGALPECEPRR